MVCGLSLVATSWSIMRDAYANCERGLVEFLGYVGIPSVVLFLPPFVFPDDDDVFEKFCKKESNDDTEQITS